MSFRCPDLLSRCRAFATLLLRLTPNKSLVADGMGMSRSLMSMYTNPDDPDHNFPAALITCHPEARTILDTLAADLGCEVVDRPDAPDINGEITDERDRLMILLGSLIEQERTISRSLNRRLTPKSARQLAPTIAAMRQVVAHMDAELRSVTEAGR